MNSPAIQIKNLRHLYGQRVALNDLSLDIGRGELFAMLGPNGGGKTTLFRILSTLLRPTSGTASVLGHTLNGGAAEVRRQLGVVFQHPSLDPKLTVSENLQHHGHLYGLRGATLKARMGVVLERVGLSSRGADRVETLSGGLQRRAELAKALLHQPPVLLLDEPSTGLDPGARRDFGQYLGILREQEKVTIVLTTHYMEEAERCDRVAILHEGNLVGIGTPGELKSRVGGDIVVIQATDLNRLRTRIQERFGCETAVVDGTLRIERPRGHELARDLVDAFPEEITMVTYGKPTLEDVFIRFTGHRFWADGEGAAEHA